MKIWSRESSLWLLVALAFAIPAFAESPAVLFENVRIFDGVDAALPKGHVLVEGDKIARISSRPIDVPEGAVVIEGNGRVLSPGFIDLHAHLTMQAPKDENELHPWAVGAIAGKAAQSYLMSGFTSGAIVTQTSGHGDFRDRDDPHPMLCGCGTGYTLGHGQSVIADGVPQWLRSVWIGS